MLGERNTLEQFTVWAEEEDNRWGTKGYKYPQIQNSNSYISEFGTSEKNLGTSDL
jgi:predicted membrane-bound dolichyl-phosphate-mannose-protein mannosyltransferase